MVAALVGAPLAVAPQPRCVVEDPRLEELSGLAVDGNAVWAMADGGSTVAVHRLDLTGPTCTITASRTAPLDPYDPEDLALGPDGALWLADIGDNDHRRATVSIEVLPRSGPSRTMRFTYPDGPHDAEALLVDRAGRPVVVVKDIGLVAGVYRTAVAPAGPGPTPLVRVGDLRLPASQSTSGPLGGLGSRLVTGAAASADGTVVAIRTYTDAWLFPAPDGDPVAALAGEPVQVPLPGEPQGEAIAFEPDGTLLSGSEARGGVRGEVHAVPGAAALVAPARAVAPTPAAPTPTAPAPAAPPQWLPGAIGGAAAALLLALIAVLALRGRRR